MKKLPKSQIEFTLEIPVEEVELFFDKAAKNISENIEIKGFRKGKAPKDVVQKIVGKQAVFEEASQLAIEKKYQEYIKENQIVVVDYPKITVKKMAESNPVVIDVVVAVYPEVKLPDYKKIAKEQSQKRKKDIDVSDDELNSALEYLLSSRAKETSVNREAKENDIAEVDFEVRLDGVKIDGGSSKNHPVKIGAGKFIPGFEDNIKGMKPKETKKFSLVAPKDYFKKDLAGKKLDFSVTLNNLFEVELPELNDDFAKSLGGFESAEALKKNIKEGLLLEKKEKEENEFRNSLLEKIAQEADIDLPDAMVEREIDKIIDEIKMNVEQNGIKFEDYLLTIKKEEKDIRQDVRKQAETRVKIGLVIDEISKKENIKIDDDKITQKANEFLLRYSDVKSAEEAISPERLKAYAKSVLISEEVIKLLEQTD